MSGKDAKRAKYSRKCIARGCSVNNLSGVKMNPVPKPWVEPMRCLVWLNAVGRSDLTATDITKNSYVCGMHWKNGTGPTLSDPNPSLHINRIEENAEVQVLLSSCNYIHWKLLLHLCFRYLSLQALSESSSAVTVASVSTVTTAGVVTSKATNAPVMVTSLTFTTVSVTWLFSLIPVWLDNLTAPWQLNPLIFRVWD